MAVEIKFGKFKEEWRKLRDKGLSTTYLVRERVLYHTAELPKPYGDKYYIEEGVILEHHEKERGSKEPFSPAQQHLIGYHYFSLLERKRAGKVSKYDQDDFWFQGSIEGGRCVFFYDRDTASPRIEIFRDYSEAVREFNRVLQERFGSGLKLCVPQVLKGCAELRHLFRRKRGEQHAV